MRKACAGFVGSMVLGLATFMPLKASAQGVTIYVGPGNPGYAYYPPYSGYAYDYPSYGYAYPNYGYGYARPYYGSYWGHNRRVARRVYRRWNRWD